MNSDGTVSGATCGSNGPNTLTVTATDALGDFNSSSSVTIIVNRAPAGGCSLTFNQTTLPDGSLNTSYSQTLTVSGANGTVTYSLSGGALPPGLSIASNGTISGSPTVAGSYTFTIIAVDTSNDTGTQTFTITIPSIVITLSPGTLPAGTVGVGYTQSVTASGGSSPYSYVVTTGTLPPGLALDGNTGGIAGSPLSVGSWTFTIQATDSTGIAGSKPYTLNIGTNSLSVNPSSLPNGSQGNPYSQTLTATGGNGAYAFTISAGALPPGLTLNGSGLIAGTPSSAGTFNFTAQATDTLGNTGARSYTVAISANLLSLSPTTLPSATLGLPYNQTIIAGGGTPPYSYSIVAGTLPTGLTLDVSGNITGTPISAGSFTFTIQASDAGLAFGSRSYTVNVGTNIITLAPPALPSATQGIAYNQVITASGGAGPYTFNVASGALPAGLSISSGGIISGMPTVTGAFSFGIQVTDSVGNIGSRTYILSVGGNALVLSPTNLPAGSLNVPYSQNVTASGGSGPYTFAIVTGALPPGLNLNSAGMITGTPVSAGLSAFRLRALDAIGNIGFRDYSMSIGTASLTVGPVALPAPIAGRPYRQTVFASGGASPYTFSLQQGSLPAGLTLSSLGQISGTTTVKGAVSFTVQALDVNGNRGSRSYTLSARSDPLADPDIQGLISSQVVAAQRFASMQVSNVMGHLQTMHGAFDRCHVDFEFGISTPPNSGPQAGPFSAPPASTYNSLPAGAYEPVPNGRGSHPRLGECSEWTSSFGLWSAGAFQFGSMSPSVQSSQNRFNTSGLTAGIDYRVNDRLILGSALGYGADRSVIGLRGSVSDATSRSGIVYGSFRLTQKSFIDASFGYGSLDYLTSRFVSPDATTAKAERNGAFWVGAVTASIDWRVGALTLSPYVGTQFTSVALEPFAERGSSNLLLSYGVMRSDSASSSIGLRGSIEIPTTFGAITPFSRLEYKQTLQAATSQPIYFSDFGPSTAANLNGPLSSLGVATGTLGIRSRHSGGLVTEVEYSMIQGTRSLRSQGLRGLLRIPF